MWLTLCPPNIYLFSLPVYTVWASLKVFFFFKVIRTSRTSGKFKTHKNCIYNYKESNQIIVGFILFSLEQNSDF